MNYQQYLASMSEVGGHQMASPLEIHAPAIVGIPILGGTMQSPYSASISYFPAFPETAHYPPKPKGRRRPVAAGPDHVKHRRTRSGCYTCRTRRVKCDERHPICDRCRKGSRDCVYPDPPQRKQKSSSYGPSRGSQPPSPATSTDEVAEVEMSRESQLEAIPDADEEDDDWAELPTPSERTRRPSISSMATSWRQGVRRSSETPSQDDHSGAGSPVPSTTTSSSHTAYPPSPSFASHLSPDLRQHFEFFAQNITHYHYCMSSDVDDFFRHHMLDLALQHEPLLHAVISFSAYHSTLRDPNGKLDVFLRHFNRGVRLLIELFKTGTKPNVGTLMTILQLATIEEYLGDWINLLGHQKAALGIMMELFTPETIMETPLGRVILLWYLRFDVFVALMGGFQTALPRVWFDNMVEYYRQKSAEEPHNLKLKYAFISADMRLLSMELSLLIARSNKGNISTDEYAVEYHRIAARLVAWKSQMDPALTDPAYLVADLSAQTPPQTPGEPYSIVGAFAPGVLYGRPLFGTTVMLAEWRSVMVMLSCQSPSIDKGMLYDELNGHSSAIAQTYEAAELYSETPRGALIIIQAPLSIAALFLPHGGEHDWWLRRKFAGLERMGYIATQSTRTKLAEIFQDEGCSRWWLPNDDGYTRVLQRVREFADERNAVAKTAQAESIRDVRHVFSKLELNPTSPV